MSAASLLMTGSRFARCSRIRPPSSLHGRLSPAIDAVPLHALAKQPEERLASVTACAQAFQQAVHGSGELQATLAISPAEAATGTARRLALPGGRRVSVAVRQAASHAKQSR